MIVNINEQEASKRYGMSIHWFRRARWAGGGPKFIKLGAAVLYPVSELDEYFNSRIVKSTSDTGRG